MSQQYDVLVGPTFVHKQRGTRYRICAVEIITLQPGFVVGDNVQAHWESNGYNHGFVRNKEDRIFDGYFIATLTIQTALPVNTPVWWVIYQGEDDSYWARPATEFFDGRYSH